MLPYVPCSELLTHTMMNNVVGSSGVGYAFNYNGRTCGGFSFATAYACTIGQIAHAPGMEEQRFSNFMLLDNGRGGTLRFGSYTSRNHFGYYTNSYINPVSRPECTYCYGDNAIPCTWSQGIRMFSNTINGEVLPKTFGLGFDVICRSETNDALAFISNVTFVNFRIKYTEPALAKCSKAHIFRPHPIAHDAIAGHHILNSKCDNC